MTELLPESRVETTQAGEQSAGFFKVPETVYTVLVLVLIAVVGWFYGQAIDTEVLGFTHDDGVYAATAKALATGKGFTLLHVVGHPAQIKYPFIYPLLLAPVWLLMPEFPKNLPLLNGVTLFFTLASCGMMYVYLRRCQQFPGWLALLVMALVTSGFFFIYFFSMVMSEAPYLFFSLLTLWAFHRVSNGGKALSTRAIALLVLLSVVTFYTRVLGVALMGAIGVWLLLNRQWKNALLYGAGCLLLGVLPWVWWVKTHAPVMTAATRDVMFPLVNAYSNYGTEFLHNFNAGSYLKGLQADFASFMNGLLEDMIPVLPNLFKVYPALEALPFAKGIKLILAVSSVYLLTGYFVLQGIRTLGKSFANGRFSSAPYTVPGLYVFFYMTAIVLWMYEDQMPRFLTVILPLLWMYFFKPWLSVLPDLRFKEGVLNGRWLKAGAVSVVFLAVSVMTLLPVAHSYKIVHTSRSQHWVEKGDYRWLWQDYQETFAYIKKALPEDAVLGAHSDVVFYLYTERPTFYIFYPSLPRANDRFLPDGLSRLMRSLDYHGVDYVVAEPHMQMRTVHYPMNAVIGALIKKYPERFRLVHASPREALGVYKILPSH